MDCACAALDRLLYIVCSANGSLEQLEHMSETTLQATQKLGIISSWTMSQLMERRRTQLRGTPSRQSCGSRRTRLRDAPDGSADAPKVPQTI